MFRSRRPQRSRELCNQKVFITGAASGIGRALAEAAGREGARLYLTDIAAEGLEQTAESIRATGGRVDFAAPADISSYEQVRDLAERMMAEHGAMNVIMNVAGISRWGTVRSLEHSDWQRLVEVNLMGPIHVIESLVPPMIEAGEGGHLVNVSSAAGIIAMPWHAAYSATKFGLRGVSEVLRFDLRRHGIDVSLVCPGAVDTGLTSTIQISGIDTTSEKFTKLQSRFRKKAETPAEAAESILAGMRRNRYWIYTSRDIQLAHAVQRFLPPLYTLLMRGFNLGANAALPEVEKARRADESKFAA